VQRGAGPIRNGDLPDADRPLPAAAGAQPDLAGAWAAGVAHLLAAL
jgi:hypothetical protein